MIILLNLSFGSRDRHLANQLPFWPNHLPFWYQILGAAIWGPIWAPYEGRVILKDRCLKGGFTPPNSKIWSKCRTHGIFFIFFWSGASCGSIVVSSIPGPQLLAELRAPTGGTKPPR